MTPMVTTDARSPGGHTALRNMRCCGAPRRTGSPGERPTGWESWDDRLRDTCVQFHRVGSWRFLFEGIEAGNGLGDDVGADAVARLWEAFQEPFDFDRVHAARLYD